MREDIGIKKLEDWQTVSCNSCARHNHHRTTINKESYTERQMYEISARSQTTVLCADCMIILKGLIGFYHLENDVNSVEDGTEEDEQI